MAGPYVIDESKPGDTEFLADFPADERTMRGLTGLSGWINEEHDETSGHHKFGEGDDAARDTITDWVVGSQWLNSEGLPVGNLRRPQWKYDLVLGNWENLPDVFQAYFNIFTKGQTGTYVALVDAATVVSDLADSNFFTLTIAGNRTLGLPTYNALALVAGRAGQWVYQITQDGSGSRTLAYHADFVFSGGVAPSLSTGAGEIDFLYVTLRSDAKLHVQLVADSS